MQVVTVITENYQRQARALLRSLARLSGVRRWCVCLGFAPQTLAAEYPHVEFGQLAFSSSDSFGMCQYGRWLEVLAGVDAHEVCLLVDADAVFQRDFTDAERARLAGLGEGKFAAGPNEDTQDNLMREARRIGLRNYDAFWGSGPGLVRVFNCGFLALRAADWLRVQDLYQQHCNAFYRLTENRSRCQWLLNWCFHQLALRVDVLGPEVCVHGHFGNPPGITHQSGVAHASGTLVLYRHRLPEYLA